MMRPKRKEPPPSAEWRPRRFLSKKWDRRLGIIAIIASIPIFGSILLDLASIITQPDWDLGDLYHAVTLVVPLAVGVWGVSLVTKNKRRRKPKGR